MTYSLLPVGRQHSPVARTDAATRVRLAVTAGAFVVALLLSGCTAAQPASEPAADDSADTEAVASESATMEEESPPASEEPAAAPLEEQPQQETCDWDAPRLTGPAEVPAGQEGELADVLVGEWQHTHTDEGDGFEEVTNDHRYVFPSADRMLYCQHVPGATEYAENAGDVVLNGAVIELPGGTYSYTVTAWDADTVVWDNPVGGGYVYLLQRR